MSNDEGAQTSQGVWQSAVDVFVASAHAVTSIVSAAGAAGAAGASAVLPPTVGESVAHMLASLRTLVEEAPQVTDELDILVDEVHAKRLSIQALQAELSALDRQLDVLERSLAPVQAWSHQMDRARRAVLHITLPAAGSAAKTASTD